jgi:endonuclease/exonuclease/phosphatase family metal-dependent hydrolase
VILAGDFNLWPEHIVPVAENNLGLVDIMGLVEDLPELKDAVGGSRIWTHKNGNSPNAARQELDFIFTTDELADEVVAASGGIDEFPNAWDVSDHAPVIVDFDS